jgi:hypothetical protein
MVQKALLFTGASAAMGIKSLGQVSTLAFPTWIPSQRSILITLGEAVGASQEVDLVTLLS